MSNCYKQFLDYFLTTVPVERLDDAIHFVNEIKGMCESFLDRTPILLHKQISRTTKNSEFFLTKNRHRSANTQSVLFNEALQSSKAFERGVDLQVAPSQTESCVIILPDSFNLVFSGADFNHITEAASLVDNPAMLGNLIFERDVTKITTHAQHVFATDIPFYYCIRVN